MIHIDILDEERTNILPLLSVVNEYKFYLAGGTSLALQIGHRDSEDFDFFREGSFNTEELSQKLEESFKGHVLLVTKEEEDTLYIEVDNNIKLSFFRYNYAMINPLIEFDYFPLASIMDIACMKLAALRNRAVLKDYVDLYYILQTNALKDITKACSRKYPLIDSNVFLRGLTYTDDVEIQKIIFKNGYQVTMKEIDKLLQAQVKNYYK
jgi:predicted nucleotidyltransferase component of viral defense system